MTNEVPDILIPSPTPRKRHYSKYVPIVAAVIVALLLLWVRSHPRRRTPNASRGSRTGNAVILSPLPVVAQSVATGDLNINLDALGSVTPLTNVTLRAQITGQLMEIDFKEGQMVKKGDLLAVIDPRPYEAAFQQAHGQLVQAEAQLKEARIDLKRYEALSHLDSIASQQVDTQRAQVSQCEGQVEADQAAVTTAKLNLTYCHVTAPVSGRVGLRQADPGNYVTAGDANGLVVLSQVKPITVIFTLSEDNIPEVAARLKSGATIPADAYDRTRAHRLASGTLAAIDNQVDSTTGTFKLRAVFPNEDEALYPSQFVNIRMLLDVQRGAIVIPTAAVERGQPGTFVYIVKPDNTVAARPVTLGPVDGERVAVLSGLAAGEHVVVEGADKLKEGMKITLEGQAYRETGKIPVGHSENFK